MVTISVSGKIVSNGGQRTIVIKAMIRKASASYILQIVLITDLPGACVFNELIK